MRRHSAIRRSVRRLLRRSCWRRRAARGAARRDAVVDRGGQQPDDPDRRRVQRPVRELAGRARQHRDGPEHRRGLRRAAEGRARARSRGRAARPPAAAAPAAAPAAPAADGRLHRAPGDTLSGLAAGARVSVERDRRDERAQPERRAARRHRDQAADRRARARPRRAARAGREGRARPRRPSRPPPASAPPTSSPSPPPTASPPRWRPRSPGRRAASTTRWSPRANARGVMQVMPGTWDYVQQNLATRQLNPHSASDNVTAGVLYLEVAAQPDRRRRVRGDRRLLPGPRRAALARRVRRHRAVRRQRAGAARPLRRIVGTSIGPRQDHLVADHLATLVSWPRPSATADLLFLLSQAAHSLQTGADRPARAPRDHAARALRARSTRSRASRRRSGSPSGARWTRRRWSSPSTSSSAPASPSAAPPPPTGARGSSP